MHVRIIALFLALIGSTAAADTGLSIGFGKAAIGSDVCFDSLIITQELSERRWLAVLQTHGKGECREQHVRANMGAGIARMTQLGKWSLGFGVAVWHHGDRAVGPREGGDRPEVTAHIHIRRYLFDERLVLDIAHSSTGGAAEYNAGRNILTLGWRVP